MSSVQSLVTGFSNYIVKLEKEIGDFQNSCYNKEI